MSVRLLGKNVRILGSVGMGAILLSGVVNPVPAHAFICTYDVDDPVMKANATAVSEEVNASFDTGLTTTSTLMTSMYEILVSAMKIGASQRSTDGQRNSTGISQSLQAYAQVVNQQGQNEDILQAQDEFGTGSEVSGVCSETAMTGEVVRAIDSVPTQAKSIIQSSNIPAAPGGTVLPRKAIATRLSSHLSRYCTQDEVTAGWCSTVGSKPAADVSAQTLFDPASTQEDVDAFINNLVGDPLDKPDATSAKTPEGVLRMATAMRAEAVRSPALVSLAALRAENAGGSGYSLVSQSGITVTQALDAIMKKYGGGPDYDTWDASVAGANQYGVLRELVRLRGLSMKLRNFQTQSQTRMGAILSTLLAAEAEDQD